MKKNIKNSIVLLIMLWISGTVNAQQDPMYTKFMFNKLVLNSAYAGSSDNLRVGAHYRTQWVGFEGAPKTMTFHAHTPMLDGMGGLGVSVVNDKIGISSSTNVALHLAYRINFGFARLAFGVNGEMMTHRMDWGSSNPLQQGDPNIPYASDNLFLPNFGAGVFFDSDILFAGISVPRFLENKLDYTNSVVSIETSATQRRHFFGMAGIIITLGPEVELVPQVLVKYEKTAPIEYDFNVMAVLDRKIWAGATYRTGDSFDVIVQLALSEKLRLGYAYDFTFSQLQQVHNGTHEVMLIFDLPKKTKGIYHPRYF